MQEASLPPFHNLQSDWVDSLMDNMTVEEKVGQLFMVAAWSNKDQRHLQELQKLIEEEYIGGICIFQGSPHKQVELLNALQESSKIPLMVSQRCRMGTFHAPRFHRALSSTAGHGCHSR